MKPIKILLIISLSMLLLQSCGTVQTYMSKTIQRMMVKTTDDLSFTNVRAVFVRNTYPADAKTIEASYFGKEWQAGRNLVYIAMTPAKGIGFIKVNGTVTIDGQPAQLANGFLYYRWIDKNDNAPKTIRIETATGKNYEFTVYPAPPVQLKAVNGTTNGTASVDVNQPLSLELTMPNPNKNNQITVAAVANILGITDFVDYAIVRYQSRVNIPPAMWQHPMQASSVKQGNNYIRVERSRVELPQVAGVHSISAIGISYDYLPVTLTGKAGKGFMNMAAMKEWEHQITSHGKTVILNKPTAFRSPPLKRGKTFAMASFTVRATRLTQSKSDKKDLETVTVTTIETHTFPKLPDAFWDNLVARLYKQFIQQLQSAYPDIQIVPIEKTLQAAAYQELINVEEKNTKVEVSRSYKGNKNLMPTRRSELWQEVTMAAPMNRPEARLIRELGVDGLIAVTIDLEMKYEDFSLTPVMSFRFLAPQTNYKAGPEIYVQGTVSGSGTAFDYAKKSAKEVMDFLPKVMDADNLMAAFGDGIRTLLKVEEGSEYDQLWQLR